MIIHRVNKQNLSLIKELNLDLNEIVDNLNKLYKRLIITVGYLPSEFPAPNLSVTTNGKLKIENDLPKCVKIFMSDRLRKKLGINRS